MASRTMQAVQAAIDEAIDAPHYAKGAPSMPADIQDMAAARGAGGSPMDIHQAWEQYKNGDMTDSDVADLIQVLRENRIPPREGDDDYPEQMERDNDEKN